MSFDLQTRAGGIAPLGARGLAPTAHQDRRTCFNSLGTELAKPCEALNLFALFTTAQRFRPPSAGEIGYAGSADPASAEPASARSVREPSAHMLFGRQERVARNLVTLVAFRYWSGTDLDVLEQRWETGTAAETIPPGYKIIETHAKPIGRDTLRAIVDRPHSTVYACTLTTFSPIGDANIFTISKLVLAASPEMALSAFNQWVERIYRLSDLRVASVGALGLRRSWAEDTLDRPEPQ